MLWPIRFKIGKCEKDIQSNWEFGWTGSNTYENDGWIWSNNCNGPFGVNWWRWGGGN